jgi:hypothetical protein
VFYQLPDQPPVTLVGPTDTALWAALGVDPAGRYAVVLGEVSMPDRALVVTGSLVQLARWLDPHTGDLPATLAHLGTQLPAAAASGPPVAATTPTLSPAPIPTAVPALNPVVAPPAAGVALVALPHTGLRVPHQRLTVTGYRQLPTADGVAFTATLRLDRTIVGTIQNEGMGGPTGFHPGGSPAFGYRDLSAFVAACRTSTDQPASEDEVLDGLVTEFLTAKRIRRAQQAGRCALRLMAPLVADDPAAGFYPVAEADAAMPSGPDARAVLAYQILRQSAPAVGEWWQVWTGQRWEDLTERPGHTSAEDR